MNKLLALICMMFLSVSISAETLTHVPEKLSFDQVKYVKSIDQSFISSGVMLYKDNIFYIQYQKPFKSELIFSKNEIIQKNLEFDTVEVVTSETFPALNIMYKYFKSIIDHDFSYIASEFFVKEESGYRFMTPKNESLQRFIQSLVIEYNNNEVKSFKIKYSTGDFTLLEFSNN